MDLNSYPAPHPQVAARIVDDEAVIVLADEGQVQVLNEVGTRIWQLADGTRTIREIIDTVVAEFQVGPEEAEQDAKEFLEALVQGKALVLEERSLPAA
jgi:hypothetical protein